MDTLILLDCTSAVAANRRLVGAVIRDLTRSLWISHRRRFAEDKLETRPFRWQHPRTEIALRARRSSEAEKGFFQFFSALFLDSGEFLSSSVFGGQGE